MQYFTYGSNLCLPRLMERGTDPSNPRIARLDGYELRFNKRSNDGSSKANISAADSSRAVWGVVFDISDDRLEGLRLAEGFPHHYTENEIDVFINGQRKFVTVTTYIAHTEKIFEGLKPYDWYLLHITRGGELHGFPGDYLTHLSEVQAIEDSNTDRSKRELGYWNSEPA